MNIIKKYNSISLIVRIICGLVIGTILGLLFKDLPVIGLANRLLGAALGAAECAALFFVSYKLYEHFLQI